MSTRFNNMKRRRSAAEEPDMLMPKRIHTLPSPCASSPSPSDSSTVEHSGGLVFPKPGQTTVKFVVTRPEPMQFKSGNAQPRTPTEQAVVDVSGPATLMPLPSPPKSPMTPGSFLDAVREARRALKKEAAEDGEELSDDSSEDSDVSRLSLYMQPLSLGDSATDYVGWEPNEAQGFMSLDETSKGCESEAEDELQRDLEAALNELDAENEAEEQGYAADRED